MCIKLKASGWKAAAKLVTKVHRGGRVAHFIAIETTLAWVWKLSFTQLFSDLPLDRSIFFGQLVSLMILGWQYESCLTASLLWRTRVFVVRTSTRSKMSNGMSFVLTGKAGTFWRSGKWRRPRVLRYYNGPALKFILTSFLQLPSPFSQFGIFLEKKLEFLFWSGYVFCFQIFVGTSPGLDLFRINAKILNTKKKQILFLFWGSTKISTVNVLLFLLNFQLFWLFLSFTEL